MAIALTSDSARRTYFENEFDSNQYMGSSVARTSSHFRIVDMYVFMIHMLANLMAQVRRGRRPRVSASRPHPMRTATDETEAQNLPAAYVLKKCSSWLCRRFV